MTEPILVGLICAGAGLVGAFGGGIIPVIGTARENRRQRALEAYSAWATSLKRAVYLNRNCLLVRRLAFKDVERLRPLAAGEKVEWPLSDDPQRVREGASKAIADRFSDVERAIYEAQAADHEMTTAAMSVQMIESSEWLQRAVTRLTARAKMDFAETDSPEKAARLYNRRSERLSGQALPLVLDHAVQQHQLRHVAGGWLRALLPGRPRRPALPVAKMGRQLPPH